MLRNLATFPHAGSRAFLAPDADPVRILRHNADGTVFVTMLPVAHDPRRHLDAAANRTVDEKDLFETAELIPLPKAKRRKATASSSAAVGRNNPASSSKAVGGKKAA